MDCVNKTDFYEAIDKLKETQTNKSSPLTLFLDQTFYDNWIGLKWKTSADEMGGKHFDQKEMEVLQQQIANKWQ